MSMINMSYDIILMPRLCPGLVSSWEATNNCSLFLPREAGCNGNVGIGTTFTTAAAA
ncbi:MAG: hypothetical protein ACR2L5_00235 [Candidatus Actinomarinaceae bacterium]